MHVCEEWEYADVPNHQSILDGRVATLAAGIFQPGFDTAGKAGNTRPAHRALFKGLTPDLYPHFAGNYRGAKLPCLDHRYVQIKSDPRVGADPADVQALMDPRLKDLIAAGVKALDTQRPSLTPGEFLIATIQFTCAVFVEFLRVHPYANGNGHIARYILWMILARYGFYLRSFPIATRPADPPYSPYIKAYRDGNPSLLEGFVLACLDPSAAS